jgi:HAD superfamily hydrolase (TIGR01484 family)
MKNLTDFNSKIEFLLTDIDDTITTEGQLESRAYDSLWRLHDAGVKVIPITGRPAGWCEMIARFWPVAGVVGENGGFYFHYSQNSNDKIKKMKRWFFTNEIEMQKNRTKLNEIQKEVLSQVKGADVASDQFCRLMDLAIDFCEDVTPLKNEEVQKIVSIFNRHGAQAKVSSIHVNGWFGNYDKLTTALKFLENEFGINKKTAVNKCAYVGDSPNDEPMFCYFQHTFGVANIEKFSDQMKYLPQFISSSSGGNGFAEITEQIIKTAR